uniref:HDC08011 n=1 Tax=Drosophila melanogaster TaxID=7227 RepID=Q6ILZ7_DROME|nr:TPA_inf: HDC08011 [Drosophila melanogaster]
MCNTCIDLSLIPHCLINTLRSNCDLHVFLDPLIDSIRFSAFSIIGPLENAANRSQIFEGGVCQGWRCQILEILRVSRLELWAWKNITCDMDAPLEITSLTGPPVGVVDDSSSNSNSSKHMHSHHRGQLPRDGGPAPM